MTCEFEITLNPTKEKDSAFIKKLCEIELRKKNISFNSKEVTFSLLKRSVDARHKNVKLHLRYKAFIGESDTNLNTNFLPQWKKAAGQKSVIIVGSGPAGLFGALTLLESGIKPTIIERGEETTDRKKTIAKISTEGKINSDSNYCFGEGGAGTFSDGKLYTRSNKRGNIERILQIFVHFGANSSILTDAHPHIGTEKLPPVINAIKNFIKQQGGEFYFNTRCTDFIIEEKNSEKTDEKIVRGIKAKNTKTGEETEFKADAVLLATGHSALDIYTLLAKTEPKCLEAKTFAMGVRIEHPRSIIDAIQYHGKTDGIDAAEYRLTTQVDGRGVYTFCMCPGGFVVPSQTSDDEIVVNGMSASKRNSFWSNSAIVVETRPEDIPPNFIDEAKNAGCAALAGLFYRKFIEKQTKEHSSSQKAPAQRVTDFIDGQQSKNLPKTSYTPGLTSSRLDEWLPEQIKVRLKQGLLDFGKKMHGFITPEAILIASETRTSTPVRILRDENGESPFLKHLYPVGEGSGYSGGIVSSALDGENIARKIEL